MQPDGLIQTTPYTLDELNDEIRKGTVNESRIPQEYALQYVQYRQQQAKQEQAQQAQQAQYQAEQQKVIIAQQQQVMQQIDAAAKQQALQALGITADELNTAEFSDDQGLKEKAAKYHDIAMWNKQQMIFALQQRQVQEQQAQQEQQNIYRGIQAFAADKQQTEPHFQEINLMMDTYYKEMPYKDAAAISEAITAMNAGTVTAEQCQVLEKYYTDTRTHFYAKKAGLSKKPQKIAVPKVEKPGNGATPQPKVVDWNKLGSMTERERRAALSAYWHGKN